MRHESVFLHFLFFVALIGPLISVTTEELYKGVVTLDELTFDKVFENQLNMQLDLTEYFVSHR